MDTQIQETIFKMIHLPSDHNKGDKSEFTLLNESGYFEIHDKISEKDIEEVLKKHPQVIEDWLQFSDDSRSSERWCFSKSDNGIYCVAFWPQTKKYDQVIDNNGFHACAAFIKRKAEFTRMLFNK